MIALASPPIPDLLYASPPCVQHAGTRSRGLLVDLFCGGIGGASKAFKRAFGRCPHICVNHDEEAVKWHRVNYRSSKHYLSDVRDIWPLSVTHGRRVYWFHASPDCTHHSRAKGGMPLRDAERRIRALPWIVLRWAAIARPDYISMENVVEILDWGPIRRFKPHKARKGQSWNKFVAQLRSLGYVVEWRRIHAHEYGAGTSRERLFMVARRDGLPVVWPAPTHGTTIRPARVAADCIRLQRPTPSIFMDAKEARALGLKRPLADDTLKRIAYGVRRFVIDDPSPFIFTIDHRGSGDGVAQSIGAPLSTITTKARHCLVVPFISKYFSGNRGNAITEPLGAITCWDHHAVVCAHLVPASSDMLLNGSKVAAFLMRYHGNGGQWARLDRPLPTITTVAGHALVTCTLQGERHIISDIGMRMLDPDELADAQGLAGCRLPTVKSKAIDFIGNSLCPDVLIALMRANTRRGRQRGVAA